MTNNEAFDIRVRKAALCSYVWIAYYTDTRRVTCEIGNGYCGTQNAAWLAGIKAVKAFQRSTEKERSK